MRDGVAYLVHETFTMDALLQRVPVTERRMIYVTERSVSRSEWHAATNNGFSPDISLTTQRVNYDGESVIEYEDNIYFIYRTYTAGDDIELYLEKRQGIQGAGNEQ